MREKLKRGGDSMLHLSTDPVNGQSRFSLSKTAAVTRERVSQYKVITVVSVFVSVFCSGRIYMKYGENLQQNELGCILASDCCWELTP